MPLAVNRMLQNHPIKKAFSIKHITQHNSILLKKITSKYRMIVDKKKSHFCIQSSINSKVDITEHECLLVQVKPCPCSSRW